MKAYICQSCGAVLESADVVRPYSQAGGALCSWCAGHMEETEITTEDFKIRTARIANRRRHAWGYVIVEIVGGIILCVGIWLRYGR